MIVLPDMALRDLMTHIVETTHYLTDTAGDAHIVATIPPDRLRMAALVAVQLATGEAVWPGDRKIVIRRPKLQHGIFEEAS